MYYYYNKNSKPHKYDAYDHYMHVDPHPKCVKCREESWADELTIILPVLNIVIALILFYHISNRANTKTISDIFKD